MDSGRLKERADRAGESVEAMVTRAIDEEGSALGAARKLGVTPNTIRYWLKKLGYEARPVQTVRWVKVDEAVAE